MTRRIGIIAGESSGDQLGAGLIRALRDRDPDIRIEAVAGPRMREAGCDVLADTEALSVMGLTEVLVHLPRLLRLRRRIVGHFRKHPPDVFVGIDAPDFNLGVEKRLRDAGVATVHYVCPSVWAWRPGRLKHIRRAADRVLALLPFEPEICRNAGIASTYVGHPMARRIRPEPTTGNARSRLDLPGDWHGAPVIGLLPGSRASEVDRLADLFFRSARLVYRAEPATRFLVPAATPSLRERLEEYRQASVPDLPVRIVDGRAHDVIAASDSVLVASGTATLEAMLAGRPMAVAYRVSPLTYRLLKGLRMVRIEHFSLPNLLAGRELVREFIQDRATPERLAKELAELTEDGDRRRELVTAFDRLGAELRRDSDGLAADAVLELCDRGCGGG